VRPQVRVARLVRARVRVRVRGWGGVRGRGRLRGRLGGRVRVRRHPVVRQVHGEIYGRYTGDIREI
jgi:hypothetical protein